jgi:hypothetical protein
MFPGLPTWSQAVSKSGASGAFKSANGQLDRSSTRFFLVVGVSREDSKWNGR